MRPNNFPACVNAKSGWHVFQPKGTKPQTDKTCVKCGKRYNDLKHWA